MGNEHNDGAPESKFDFFNEYISEILDQMRAKLGFYCFWCLFNPVVAATVLFSITLSVAGIVFGIQALIVGTVTYDSPPICQERVGVWLVVFGSLSLSSAFFSFCICTPVKVKKKKRRVHKVETDPYNEYQPFVIILSMATFAWLCYGMVIYYKPDGAEECSASQYRTFRIMLLFMFWGSIALIAAFLLIFCMIYPFIPSREPPECHEQDEEQPCRESDREEGSEQKDNEEDDHDEIRPSTLEAMATV